MIELDGQNLINVHEVCAMVQERCPNSKFKWQAVSTYIARGKLPQPKYKIAGRNFFDLDEVKTYIDKEFIVRLR